MQYTAIFHGSKNENFYIKIDFFFIFAQNTNCGYTLEPPQGHNLCFRAKIRKNVYPCKPQFYYIKVGCKGVFIARTCLHDEVTTLTYLGPVVQSNISLTINSLSIC